MLRKLMLGAVTIAALAFSTTAFAQGQFGTAAEAKAMLEKAVAAVKADKAKALDQMQKGEGGFKDRDLYAFCANASDGIITAHPALKGKNIRDDQRQGWEGPGRRDDESRDRRQGRRSELYVAAAGRRHDASAKGQLRDQSRRSSLRRRLLQVTELVVERGVRGVRAPYRLRVRRLRACLDTQLREHSCIRDCGCRSCADTSSRTSHGIRCCCWACRSCMCSSPRL